MLGQRRQYFMPQISVVVPFYNCREFIEACIDGLLTQDYPAEQYEIIMVDNNSTDDSKEIVKKYPRIKLFSESKQGSYAARNRGLREVSGQIIAFTDPDCIPSSDWLQKIDQAFLDPVTGIVLGGYQLATDSFGLDLMRTYEQAKSKFVFGGDDKSLYFGHTNNMAVRKQLMNELGPFIERLRGADSIFVRYCVEQHSCEIVRYIPEITVQHLEIDKLYKLYKKVFIYGFSRRRYRHLVNVRALTNHERYQIFRNAIEHRGWPWIKVAAFVVLLSVGMAFWASGNVSALMSPDKNP